tara:strand:- start:1228 stop:1551 length:324 start_codon:yes stop_codon:yes gene_type:complete
VAKEGVFVYREEFGAEGFQGRGGCSHDDDGLARRVASFVLSLSLSLSLCSPLGHAGGPRRPPREKNDDDKDDDALEIVILKFVCTEKKSLLHVFINTTEKRANTLVI